MARRLIVEVIGDSAQLERSLARAGGSAKAFGSEVQGVSGRVSASFKSLIGAALPLAGALAGGEALKMAIDGAENLKKAHNSLAAALEHTGENASQLVPAFDQVAKSAASLGVNQTDATAELAKAVALTGNAKAAMRAYTEALNLSKGAHVSFEAALTATAKGQEGITTSLKRYGIEIKKGTSGVEQYRTVMARFGGQAQANTSSLDVLRAKSENLAAAWGGPLLDGLSKVAGVLVQVTGFLQDNTAVLGPIAVVVGAVAGAWGLYTLATGAAAAASELATGAMTALSEAMDANPIGLVALALVGLGTALYEAWTHSATFRRIVEESFHAVEEAAQKVATFVTQTIPTAFENVLSWLRGHWPEIATIIAGPFAPIVGLATNAFGVRSALEGAFRDVANVISNVVHHAVDGLEGAFRALAAAIKAAILPALKGLEGAFGSLAGALHSVEAAAGAAYSAVDKLVHLAKGAGGLVGKALSVVGLAEGGIVTSPTLAVVGESGPEAVVPLRNIKFGGVQPLPAISGSLGRAGGGGTVINNFSFPNYVGNKEQLAATVRDEFIKLGRREPGIFGGLA